MDTTIGIQSATEYPLPSADLDSLGFRREQIDRLTTLIEQHVAEGHYPGCQMSFAYITNNRIPDPWHSRRLDLVANLVHTAII